MMEVKGDYMAWDAADNACKRPADPYKNYIT